MPARGCAALTRPSPADAAPTRFGGGASIHERAVRRSTGLQPEAAGSGAARSRRLEVDRLALRRRSAGTARCRAGSLRRTSVKVAACPPAGHAAEHDQRFLGRGKRRGSFSPRSRHQACTCSLAPAARAASAELRRRRGRRSSAWRAPSWCSAGGRAGARRVPGSGGAAAVPRRGSLPSRSTPRIRVEPKWLHGGSSLSPEPGSSANGSRAAPWRCWRRAVGRLGYGLAGGSRAVTASAGFGTGGRPARAPSASSRGRAATEQRVGERREERRPRAPRTAAGDDR